jgi:hypothetical protein
MTAVPGLFFAAVLFAAAFFAVGFLSNADFAAAISLWLQECFSQLSHLAS